MIEILIALTLLGPGILAIGFIWIGLMMLLEGIAEKFKRP